MNVRAKFSVQSIETTVDGSFVKLHPVTGTSEENKQFFKWTPSGELRMGVVNPEVAAAFVPGAEFYIDFTPAASS